MGIDTLRSIATTLGCSASYLLEGVEPHMSPEEEELLKIFNGLKSGELKKSCTGPDEVIVKYVGTGTVR